MEKQLLYIYIDDFYGFQKQGFNFSTKEIFCVYETEMLILQKQDLEKPFLQGFWGESILDIHMLIGDNGSGKTTLMKIITDWICCCSEGKLPQEKGMLVFRENESIGYIAFEKGDKLDISVNIPGVEEYGISRTAEFVKDLQLLYFSNTMTDLNLDSDILSDCSLYQRMIEANENAELSDKNIIENFNLAEFRNQVDIALNRNIEDFPVYNLQMEVRYLDFWSVFQGRRERGLVDRFKNLWEEYFGSSHRASEGEQLVIELLKILLIGVTKHVLRHNHYEERTINKMGEMLRFYDSVCTESSIEKCIENVKDIFKDLILDNMSDTKKDKMISDIYRFVSLLQSSVRNAASWPAGVGELSLDREGNIVINIDSDNREKFKDFWVAYKEVMIYMEAVSFSWIASSGEKNWVSLFSILTSVSRENVWLFLDEPDNTLHPDWQRKLLDQIIEVCNGKNYEGKKVQIWISTHSPIMLSDMPGNSVIYLSNKKNVDKQIEETFGQNIYALFNHAFFLHEGVIGTFASKKIEEVMDRLQKIESRLLNEENDSHSSDRNYSDLEYCERIVELLAEPLFKRYFMDSIGKIKELQSRKRVHQE